MKTILGAIALTFAAPVVAQAIPPAIDPIAQRQAMDHSQHAKEEKHDCKKCCEKMKGKDGKMECMDKKDGAGSASNPTSADAHSAHAH